MKLILRRLRWMNFLSTGNQWTELDLFNNKLTLLYGNNGSGKTTVLDALSFALFNKAWRDTNKPKLVNTITRKDCLVECEFEINKHQFMVRRGIKPSIFEIYKDGKLINEDPDNRDYQAAFEKYILRINHQTFCQIVILGSDDFVPFMKLKAPQRRAIVEDIVNLTVFSEMNKLLRARMNDEEKTLDKKIMEKTILENKIELTEKHLKELQETHQEAIMRNEDQIEASKRRIQELDHALYEIDEDILGREDHIDHRLAMARPKHTELVKIRTELHHKLQITNKDLLFLMDHETCPTCKQVLQKEFKENAIKEKKEHTKEVEEALIQLESSIVRIEQRLADIQKLEDDLENVKNNRSEMDRTKIHYMQDMEEAEEEIKAIHAKIQASEFDKLDEIKGELDGIVNVIIEMSELKAVMDYAMVLLKDSGIKSRIIKTFIPIINQLIAKYSATLDFFVEFTLDENFEEKILSRYRDEFSYGNFSGGEKMRLNLAILFTWRAIAKLRSSIDINLIILDEILDSSLDKIGINDILNLLTTMIDDNILIISPRGEQVFNIEKFNNVVHFEKNRNFSQIV